ncbi:MAG: hypothetical protein ACI30O_02245 [Muribaculaceae bacterium]|jgi:hypothetical protein
MGERKQGFDKGLPLEYFSPMARKNLGTTIFLKNILSNMLVLDEPTAALNSRM